MLAAVILCFFVLVFKCIPCACIFIIAPEDIATGSAAIYGFTPRFVTGNDHRVGFGFRFGNHADFQVLYELGPQVHTRPLQPLRVRSASYRQRVVRRRPLLELLLRAGLLDLKDERYEVEVQNGYEPR